MRLLLVGAFPYPHPQGSQVYFQEQALALRDAGAHVELLTYGSGASSPEAPPPTADFVHYRTPRWTAPRSVRSGPSWGKPLADASLTMTLRQTVASRTRHDAYDAILTHNVEACTAALALSKRRLPAHVYCAHTLLGEELSTYVTARGRTASRSSSATGASSWGRRRVDALGHRVDHALARRVDGWIALTHSAQRVMRQSSTCPGERIAPPVSDPRRDPGRLDPAEVAARYGLELGGFFLYAGNLDGYQDVELLGDAARLLTEAIAEPERRPRLVVASHDPAGASRVARMPGVEFREVKGAHEMIALLGAAKGNLLTRRVEGGFPMKLANALAVGTPSIAFHGREWGLREGEDSLIASIQRPAATLAGSILKLAGDANLEARLRVGARRLYEAQHSPASVAARTLGLIDKVVYERARRQRSLSEARTRDHGR